MDFSCQLKPSEVSCHFRPKLAILLTIECLNPTDRSDAKDFEYFMTQGNFLKVVDTLEKYQQRVVNTQSDSGKEFILFKRQLY